MQFARTALIEAIDEAIKRDAAAVTDVEARNAQANAEHRAEWLSLHRDHWMKATADIRKKLRNGQPVTENDIPRDRTGYHAKAFYRPIRQEEVPRLRTELIGLRQVLAAIVDEQVSTTALRTLGVGVNTLRTIVPLLGQATVRSESVKAVK